MVYVSIKGYMSPLNWHRLYVTFKLAPDLKKNTVFLSNCIPLNEGHLSILTNSMLQTYTSDIEECIIL